MQSLLKNHSIQKAKINFSQIVNKTITISRFLILCHSLFIFLIPCCLFSIEKQLVMQSCSILSVWSLGVILVHSTDLKIQGWCQLLLGNTAYTSFILLLGKAVTARLSQVLSHTSAFIFSADKFRLQLLTSFELVFIPCCLYVCWRKMIFTVVMNA